MKIFNLTAIIFFFSLLSCNTKETKQLNDKITQLNLVKNNQKQLIDSLTSKRTLLKDKKKSLKGIIEDNYIKKEQLKQLTNKKWHFLVSKENVLKHIYSSFDLQENPFFKGLEYSVLSFLPQIRENDKFDIADRDSFLIYQLSLFDRSSENIKDFFSDDTIDLITSFFINNRYYKTSGAEYFVEALLLAYENLPGDKNQTLTELYNGFAEEGYWFLNSKNELKEKIVSSEVLRYLSENKYSSYIFTEEYEKERDDFIPNIYSFWARRHHEGNKEIVYDILKKVNDKIKELNHYRKEKEKRDKKALNVIKSDNFSIEKINENIIEFIYGKMNFIEEQFEEAICNFSILVPRNHNYSYYQSEEERKLNTVFTNFDRSSKNIKQLATPKLVSKVVQLLNMLPKNHDLKKILKQLLLTYEEMSDNECKRLMGVFDDKQFVDVTEKLSSRVSKLIEKEELDYNLQGESSRNFGYQKRIFYIYSFWIRRYHEGNKELVYGILKSIDSKLQD